MINSKMIIKNGLELMLNDELWELVWRLDVPSLPREHLASRLCENKSVLD